LPAVAHPDQKVAGECHALQRQLQPASHLQEQHAQRDGDTGAALQHVIQIGVARVIVVIVIALKSLLAEQEPSQLLCAAQEARACCRPRPHAGGQGIKLCDAWLRIQVRIADTGNLQRPAVEPKGGLALLRQGLKPLHVHRREILAQVRQQTARDGMK